MNVVGCCLSVTKLIYCFVSVRRLSLCEELEQASCGDVLFHGYLGPPCMSIYMFILLPTFTFTLIDSRPRGPGFERHGRHCVVVLEHLS